jgi:H+/gluconate symporter-like permease
LTAYTVELLGILIALGLLIFLAFRGFTLLLAAPAAAIVAAAFSGEPVLRQMDADLYGGDGALHYQFLPIVSTWWRLWQADG